MDTKTGEIREFPKGTKAPEGWTRLSRAEANNLAYTPPIERPAALIKWRARKARLHAKALARSRRNQPPRASRP